MADSVSSLSSRSFVFFTQTKSLCTVPHHCIESYAPLPVCCGPSLLNFTPFSASSWHPATLSSAGATQTRNCSFARPNPTLTYGRNSTNPSLVSSCRFKRPLTAHHVPRGPLASSCPTYSSSKGSKRRIPSERSGMRFCQHHWSICLLFSKHQKSPRIDV